MSEFLTRRQGGWYFVRRVPASLAAHDKRVLIRVSTKIKVADDPRGTKAAKVAEKINADLETFWRGSPVGRRSTPRHATMMRAAGPRCSASTTCHRMSCSPGPIETSWRVQSFGQQDGTALADSAGALLGGVARPAIMLSALFDRFEEILRASLRDFSPDQLRKWRNPKKRALANLITVIGDKALAELTRDNALDFQAWWQGRVVDEDLEIETANKDVGHLTGCFARSTKGCASSSRRCSAISESRAARPAAVNPTRPPSSSSVCWPTAPSTSSTRKHGEPSTSSRIPAYACPRP